MKHGDYDLCIIGGGIAGLWLASELSETQMKIAILERGSYSIKHPSKDDLISVSDGIRISRESLNYSLGGNVSTWDGWLAKIPESDFLSRKWLGISKWPIDYSEISEAYQNVENKLVELKLFQGFRLYPKTDNFDRQSLVQLVNLDNFKSYLIMSCKSNINLNLKLNSRVFNISRKGKGFRIQYFDNGVIEYICAKNIVLSANTIESVRLLNNSFPGVNPNLGKYFMEHPKGTVANIEFQNLNNSNFDENLEILLKQSPHELIGLRFGYPNQEKYKVLNHYFRLEKLATGRNKLISKSIKSKVNHELYAVRFFGEMKPESKNEICFLDYNHTSPAIMKLKPDQTFYDSIKIIYDYFLEYLQECNQVESVKYFGTNDLRDASHHMGGLRMGLNSIDSVVNASLESHDFPNLFILGASTFPTSSSVNPTFTILAMANLLSKTLGSNNVY